MRLTLGEYGDDGVMLSVSYIVLRSSFLNDPRSGLLRMSGGRLFQTVLQFMKSCVCTDEFVRCYYRTAGEVMTRITQNKFVSKVQEVIFVKVPTTGAGCTNKLAHVQVTI